MFYEGATAYFPRFPGAHRQKAKSAGPAVVFERVACVRCEDRHGRDLAGWLVIGEHDNLGPVVLAEARIRSAYAVELGPPLVTLAEWRRRNANGAMARFMPGSVAAVALDGEANREALAFAVQHAEEFAEIERATMYRRRVEAEARKRERKLASELRVKRKATAKAKKARGKRDPIPWSDRLGAVDDALEARDLDAA